VEKHMPLPNGRPTRHLATVCKIAAVYTFARIASPDAAQFKNIL